MMKYEIYEWREKTEMFFWHIDELIHLNYGLIELYINPLKQVKEDDRPIICVLDNIRNSVKGIKDNTHSLLEYLERIQEVTCEGEMMTLKIRPEQLFELLEEGRYLCAMVIKEITECVEAIHRCEEEIGRIFLNYSGLKKVEARFDRSYRECEEIICLCKMFSRYLVEMGSYAQAFQCCSASPGLDMIYVEDTSASMSAMETISSCKTTQSSSEVEAPKIDSVRFSAVTNKSVVPGEYLSIDIIMYEDEFREIVEELLNTSDEKMNEKQSGYQDVERNSDIRIILSSPDVEVDDDIEERKWCGKFLEFNFVVDIPEDYKKKQILFIANIYINNVIASKLKFVVKSDSKKKESIHIAREDIMSAFVSYASQDRNKVATIIQGIQKARPDMNIFFDASSLHSGQYWEEILRKEINERDVFYLCWSKFAKKSKWVEMEWRYALECKGEEFIEPIPIDAPSECPPPEELNKKHFNDSMLYIIKATEE